MTDRHSFPRSTPEAQGVSSAGIRAMIAALEASELEVHSIMVLRHGHVVAEGWWAPYAPSYPHMLFSLSKSFTSTAVGMAVAEGLLSVDDRVCSFFPDSLPAEVSENLAALQVRHLLTMSVGHATDSTGRMVQAPDRDWVKAFLHLPIEHEPGTRFLYNTGATYMLSAIVQKVTGQTVLDYLRPRLFEPLGIANPTWETCPKGISVGGWGLSITTEDIARFGQLYLHEGQWNGRQLLPKEWVAEATANHIDCSAGRIGDWTLGYGYQFWRSQHGAYRGDGAFGQFCLVLPAQDAVVAITAGTGKMQTVLDKVWENLMPAMSDSPLPPDEAAHTELQAALAALKLNPPAGPSTSPLAPDLAGRRYVLDENPAKISAFAFTCTAEACAVTQWFGPVELRFECGWGRWMEQQMARPGGADRLAASAMWADDNTLVLTLQRLETPFCETVTVRFDGDRMNADITPNVSFEPWTLHLSGRTE